ncbi:MAG TPA: alpha/beta hydrolase-fold protein [Bryobacteraceae bacterium]|nr:alpha/beta hydrolase-fold protein [Bryobacteraceae bacterium]
MRRDFHNWYSSRLGRNMELLVFGEGGVPVVVFPTSRGRFFEYENSGMIHVLAQKIEECQLQMFCVDSVDGESWYNHGVHPHVRVMRHLAYESYILHEVAPLMQQLSDRQQICTTGCGFGGYHALNFALKHPDLTAACITMSGTFDLRPFMNGYYDNDFYLNNPVDYVPNLADSWFLDRYQQMRIVLAAGDHDIGLGENFRMAEILGRKGIPHWLDVWTGAEPDDWPLWQRMALKFF